MSQDHNDIYSIVERLAILEGRITPTSVKSGLNKQQRSVPQMPALFKPKTQKILGGDPSAKNPMSGYAFGDSVEDEREPVEEAVATEDVLDRVKKSFADYLINVADEIKSDSDIKDKKKEDTDLKKKQKADRDLVAKEKKELDEAQQLHVGDPIIVVGANEFEGKTGEISEFSPSGKFVVVNLYNHGEHSMHLSDVKYNDYADDEDVDDAWTDDEPAEIPVDEADVATLESRPVKRITLENGCECEVHGNDHDGYRVKRNNREVKSKFTTVDEAIMALEMFNNHMKKKAQPAASSSHTADYVEEKK